MILGNKRTKTKLSIFSGLRYYNLMNLCKLINQINSMFYFEVKNNVYLFTDDEKLKIKRAEALLQEVFSGYKENYKSLKEKQFGVKVKIQEPENVEMIKHIDLKQFYDRNKARSIR